LTLHDRIRDYKIRSKLCAILEHELGLAQDNHQRGQTRGNDVMPKSGQESFQAWLQRHAQGFIDATSWEEFHGIADAHGVRLDLRANGFVFTNRRSLIHVKASSIDRRLAKTALEARLALLWPLTTSRAVKSRNTRRGLGLPASILRGCGKNTRRSANCIRRCARLSS
jgi:Relaxase/Mobilisation nuclease domain.